MELSTTAVLDQIRAEIADAEDHLHTATSVEEKLWLNEFVSGLFVQMQSCVRTLDRQGR